MIRPLFQLSPRLEACAQMVRACDCMADIGTDHALLPIWLIKTGRVKRAVASDINSNPLTAARENAIKYRIEDQLETRLSDGLKAFQPHEADEIVIAGMGGQLILDIITPAAWLQASGKHLVLQPMSMAARLRQGLYNLGFAIQQEHAVQDSGKVYSVMSVVYEARRESLSPMTLYMGKLQPGEGASAAYAEKVCRMLNNELDGLKAGAKLEKAEKLLNIINNIKKKYMDDNKHMKG